ncbi:branched-chain amino acid ABC transporter permease [Alkalibacillus aidingensis]|uniref:branched-chain amino acid ABC transporter permease n=1 Tax=Alkalibacillus aidingensis TaxID=2747607 RepID=UPI0016614D18|nr:branched-chain amino acid ABC transporter permease [Alkalibacillus aidingensis]
MIMQKLHKSTWIYFAIVFVLILLPFFKDDRWFLFLMIQIFVFAIFAMSYDLLLGYTGIVSFGHAMFFGIGAYSVAVTMNRMESTFPSFLLGVLVAVFASGIVAFLAGILTLKLKSHYYAMLTLALAGMFLYIAERWRSVTGGNDGFTFRIPELPGALQDHRNLVIYLFTLFMMVILFFGMKRLTESPLGRVLVGIRENDQRVESLGFRIMPYKVLISIISGVVAALAGVLYAISLRFVNTQVFDIEVTLDALLMTIIGGVGTLIGPIIGSAIINLSHHFLSDLANVHWIFQRWVILFGVIFILAMIFFPNGIVGTIKQKVEQRRMKRRILEVEKQEELDEGKKHA